MYVLYPGGELCPASVVYLVAWRQNSFLSQRYVLCRSGRSSNVRVCPVSGGRTLCCFRGMSGVRVAELCAASGVCPVFEWQNCVQRLGYVQCRSGRTLPIVRGCQVSGGQHSVYRQWWSIGRKEVSPYQARPQRCMSMAWRKNSSPASGICPAAWRQNSVLIQRYFQYPSGRTLSTVRVH
ncbi:hypothetical protein TNIN_31501 [Trichonephila inaurata madagascariensis]|uniref:Uncharacterized protein n=1 Tax=Trichonephila inaurata madagascariensis TaxID=2747483 RepID=A0A8X7BTR5_9ARAC|nr:hypothetical protein TNIN_31501 [Trichonephila inaurata madagascariensis]